VPQSPNEITWLRDFYNFTSSGSAVGDLFRTRLIPGFITVFGLLIPSDIQAFYVTVRAS
jgi:hypothetical protein